MKNKKNKRKFLFQTPIEVENHSYQKRRIVAFQLHKFGRSGRNAPCYCGKNKKYKNCCMQFDNL